MNRQFAAVSVAVVLSVAISVSTAAAQEGLVAHYTFDEAKGDVLKDVTGHGNDGAIKGAVWVKTPAGHGLKFDGKDDYVDFGDNRKLKISGDMTLIVWLKLASETYLDYDTNWIVAHCETYNKGGFMFRLNGDRANPTYRSNQHDASQHVSADAALNNNTIYHVAFTKKAGEVTIYLDGAPVCRGRVKDPIITTRAFTLSNTWHSFCGIMDDACIYSRALSPDEIMARFRKEAGRMGRGVLNIEVWPNATGGVVSVNAHFSALGNLPPGASLVVELRQPGRAQSLMREKTLIAPGAVSAGVTFEAVRLTPGDYEVVAEIRDGKDKRITRSPPEGLAWPGPIALNGAKRLNNLVIELLNVKSPSVNKTASWAFSVPFDSWVFVSSAARIKNGGRLSFALDAAAKEQAIITQRAGPPRTAQAIRYLSAGRHTLKVWSEGDTLLDDLVVRSVPELMYCQYPISPHVREFGPYDWAFLNRHVLPHANAIFTSEGVTKHKDYRAQVLEWRVRGGRVFFHARVPYEDPYREWSTHAGFQDPLADGIIVDEFPGAKGHRSKLWKDAVERIYREDKFKNRMIYGYTFNDYYFLSRQGRGFFKAMMENDGKVSIERYLTDDITLEGDARAFLEAKLKRNAAMWERIVPGSLRHLIINFGYMAQPPETLNVNPSVDFKVFMDLEMNLIANDPTYRGLSGLSWYLSSYGDEETVRWGARLFRHYAIEGNKDMLSHGLGYKYELDHVRNPDFADGTQGWTIRAAEPGSVAAREFKGWSWLQGRYPRTSRGDTFLWMKRNAKKPNTFSQTIRNIVPGRTYSMKMFISDYQELVKGKSAKQTHAFSVKIDNVTQVPGRKDLFTHICSNCYSHHMGAFDRNNKYYMNYHWRVFCANGTTAELTVSDWKSDKEPGGLIGQELMFNFIEIQPYFE